MANLKQTNRRDRPSTYFGPVHPFKVIDCGGGFIAINRGSFSETGVEGSQKQISEDQVPMMEHIFEKFDPQRVVEVFADDVIYALITYNMEGDEEDEDAPPTPVSVKTVQLLKGPDPNVGDALDKKIIRIASITDVRDIEDSEEGKVVEFVQEWKSDIVDGVATGVAAASSQAGCSLTEGVEMDVVTDIRCYKPESGDSSGCVVLIPKYQTIKFCGEKVGMEWTEEHDCCSAYAPGFGPDP